MVIQKRKRFLKIAEARTNKILATLKLLANCSNKSNYAYTNIEVKKIFKVIDSELFIAKNAFNKKIKSKSIFILKGKPI